MAGDDEEQKEISASLAGDSQAFELLIQRYQKMIHSLTFRMTGSLADAEDLAQETFLHAYQQLEKFRGESSFSSWLYRIAINRCLNFRKQTQCRQQLEEHWSHEQFSSGTNDATTEVVSLALLQLPPKQRAAIVMTVYDGLNHAEAAKILGCSETTVSWRIFSARQKLKKLLRNAPRGVET